MSQRTSSAQLEAVPRIFSTLRMACSGLREPLTEGIEINRLPRS